MSDTAITPLRKIRAPVRLDRPHPEIQVFKKPLAQARGKLPSKPPPSHNQTQVSKPHHPKQSKQLTAPTKPTARHRSKQSHKQIDSKPFVPSQPSLSKQLTRQACRRQETPNDKSLTGRTLRRVQTQIGCDRSITAKLVAEPSMRVWASTGSLGARPSVQLRKDTQTRITAFSYAVMEQASHRLLASRKAQFSLEVASLTKVMTCMLVLQILSTQQLDMTRQEHVVSAVAERMPGTSAEILTGEIYTIEQLLYAMMLPSGNDAAVALAEWGGLQLRKAQASNARPSDPGNPRAFIKEMNVLSSQLGLKSTRWANPHGLPNGNNRSTACDMALLCSLGLQDPIFRKVVSTQQYEARIRTVEGTSYCVEWENTNKLLSRPGFFGIKTGVTDSAGPCLASSYECHGREFVIVVLRASRPGSRYRDTRMLLTAVLRELAARECGWQEVLRHHWQRKDDSPDDNDEDCSPHCIKRRV